ncbi:hypothetical protein [uncultured Draconibacterium sp.]|uniref:hypothetical protein n=1 Tax=uncultured Draconibacterium sp. TaxID=1573823 RepID=UPI0029C92BBE|nr:hypothetical protein [uncultured Draconibacterium sp.]
MKQLFTVLLIAINLFAFAQISTYSPKDMESWQSIGQGNGFVTHDQFFMEEVEGSKGFMIFSPHEYEDVVLRYEVMTLNAATVLVAILNASDKGESKALTLNENSDNFGFWSTEVEDYMFGFRVMAHNSTPYLRKYPATNGESAQIALADKDVMHSGWRHQVECGKKANKLWLKIDGETLFEVNDNKPLKAGKIAIRVRGTANELGKCMIRNLVIEGSRAE